MIAFNEIVREALKSQAAAKQRTVLALIGIVIGIGSVIALVTVGEMVQLTSEQQFRQMGTNIITIQRGWGDSKGGAGNQDRQGEMITWSEAKGLAKKFPKLEAVSPYTSSWGQPLYADKSLDMPVLGVTGSFKGTSTNLPWPRAAISVTWTATPFLGCWAQGQRPSCARGGPKSSSARRCFSRAAVLR